MKTLAAALLLLVACKNHDEEFKKEAANEPLTPEVSAKKEAPPPPPKKKQLTPEELGKCDLEISGAIKGTQSTPGGRTATNVSYWYTAEEAKSMAGVDGFAITCKGSEVSFSMLPGGGKKDGMPFGPKKYTFTKGKGDAYLNITFGPKTTMDEINGFVDVTRFDKQRIAGTVSLTGKTMPGKAAVTLKGSFDFACPGFSGCE